MKVAISGGGVAGLCVAAVLAERGHAVQVFERFQGELNVDEIQRLASPPLSPIAAAREFLARLARAERAGENFAVETTLATKTYAARIQRWQSAGYHVVLHFIEVPSADFAVARVARRVAAGGHDIPEADIRRRFARGRQLFFALYQPLVSEYFHWSSDDHGLQLRQHQRNAP